MAHLGVGALALISYNRGFVFQFSAGFMAVFAFWGMARYCAYTLFIGGDRMSDQWWLWCLSEALLPIVILVLLCSHCYGMKSGPKEQ